MAIITPKLSVKNSILTQILNALDAGAAGGTIKLYTGTKPADADTAVTTQTLLGTMTCAKPSATVASGAMVFNAITQDSSADATGTATWARFSDSDGNTVADVDAGITGSSAFLQMNTTSIVAGGPITVTSCTITV